MTGAATSYDILPPASLGSLPAEVAGAAADTRPCLVVAARRDGRVVAYVVAAPEHRTVEVFHLADPVYGYDPRLVIAAARFRLQGGRVFHDRYRMGVDHDQDPDQRVHYREEIIRSSESLIYRIEAVDGMVKEDEFPGDDPGAYAPSPEPGDWGFFVEFLERRRSSSSPVER